MLRESLEFKLGSPDSTPSTRMEVSEYPESGRVQHDQADDTLVTTNRNKGKFFAVLEQRTKRRPLSMAASTV